MKKELIVVLIFVSLLLTVNLASAGGSGFFANFWDKITGKEEALLSPDNWIMHTIEGDANSADGTELFDFNEDGHIDIATPWEGKKVVLYINPGLGAGAWDARVLCPSNCGPVEDTDFVDLDGVGRQEIVVIQHPGDFFLYWANDPEGLSWTKYTISPDKTAQGENVNKNWKSLFGVQLDGLNGLDIVAGGGMNNVYWIEAPANPKNVNDWKFHLLTDTVGGSGLMSVISEDMDGDGDNDVMISDRAEGVVWFENRVNEGVMEHWTPHQVGTNACPDKDKMRWMVYKDFDGDGIKDFIGADSCKDINSAVTWFKGPSDPSGQWIKHTIGFTDANYVGENSKGVDIGDIDRDGKNDVVVVTHNNAASNGKVAYWLKQPDAGITETQWEFKLIYDAGGTKHDEVQLADIDKDGDLDMVSTEEDQRLGVFWVENQVPPVQVCNNNNQCDSDLGENFGNCPSDCIIYEEDLDQSGCVDGSEITTYIGRWLNGNLDIDMIKVNRAVFRKLKGFSAC